MNYRLVGVEISFRNDRSITKNSFAPRRTQCDQISTVTFLNLTQTSRDNTTTFVDQQNVVAKFLGRLHQVSREDDRLIPRLKFRDDIHQEFDVDRIESGEWLVEDKKIRIVHYGRNELDLLLHSLRQIRRLLFLPIAQLHAV